MNGLHKKSIICNDRLTYQDKFHNYSLGLGFCREKVVVKKLGSFFME